MGGLSVLAIFASILLSVSGDHECGQLGGTCMFTSYPCYGTWNSGLCLGPEDRQCCVHYPSHGKILDPGCTDKGGVCQMSDKACAGHHDLRKGLCSGPAERVCCIEEPADPFGGFTRPPNVAVDGNGETEYHVTGPAPKTENGLDIRWRDICGVPGEHMKNGILAASGSWPWQTLVASKHSNESFCGGTLVAPNYVLTSASCIDRIGSIDLYIRLGENDVFINEGKELQYDVKIVYVHEKFNGRHNLALLKLVNESVDLEKPEVNTACLPHPKQSFHGKDCWVYGWRLLPNDRSSGTLKQLRVSSLTPRMCSRQIWGFTEGKMCTTNRQQVACLANLGSGLVCEDGGRFYLAGVADFKDNSCTKDHEPAAFTDVSFYLNWLYLKTRKSYADS